MDKAFGYPHFLTLTKRQEHYVITAGPTGGGLAARQYELSHLSYLPLLSLKSGQNFSRPRQHSLIICILQ